MVAVAEISTAHGKSPGLPGASGVASRAPRRLRGALSALAIALAWGALPSGVQANPIGGVAIQGQATFTTNGNNLLVTTQNGAGLNHSALNWQSFSIPTGSSTFFQQPNAGSTSINRVVTSTPSLIFGSLGSNGNLVLVNQSGITVGAGAVVDTAGFTASALRMSDADALSGRLRFGDASSATGAVSVQGSVLARSGDVVLMGSSVDTGSSALVQAPNGSTVLAAGQQIEITGRGLEGIVLQVQAPTDSAVNLGTLQGDAVGIFAGTLKHSGLIQANAVSTVGGKVVLQALQQADVDGAVRANGATGGQIDIAVAHSADASSPGALVQSGALSATGTAGAGGTVRLNADAMLLSGAITTDGATHGGHILVQARNLALSTTAAAYSASGGSGAGGTVLVDGGQSNYTSGHYTATGSTGGNVTLAGATIKLAATQVDASGTEGGGSVHVGGQMHGAAGFAAAGVALDNASNVYANSAVSLKADALQAGNGGEVVMWADQAMRASGTLSAQGGANSGSGGRAEVSGLASLGYNALTDLSARHGSAGTLLLDPKNITVVAGSGGWSGLGSSFSEILDPTPSASEGFGGYTNRVMGNGAIVVSSPQDSSLGANRGAVYFFSSSGALNATLVGAAAGDQVSSGGVSSLDGDILLVSSPRYGFNATSSLSKGAYTWVNGATGALNTGALGGTVGVSNSLVGAAEGDQIATMGYTTLNSGNLLIRAPLWGSAGVPSNGRGAITWMNATTGLLSDGSTGGVVSAANSIVGSTAGDKVGLYSGNYYAGGSYLDFSGVTPAGDNALVLSSYWNNGGSAPSAGAVTWINGTTGHLSDQSAGGQVSATNSLVGTAAGDSVGVNSSYSYSGYSTTSQATAIGNGNFLIRSGNWGSGGNLGSGRGAVSFINSQGLLADGSTGGAVSALNSIVGSSQGDQVGAGFVNSYTQDPGVVVLSAGAGASNYFVVSSQWGGGRGAVTWGDGAVGSKGTVSGVTGSTNALSLTGVSPLDYVGAQGLVAATGSHNVLVQSPWFDNASATDAGALTWMSVTDGHLSTNVNTFGGVVSSSNSVLGTTAYDNVGSAGTVTALGSGNFVAKSPVWGGSGQFTGVGALTWIKGSNGQLANTTTGGAISASNSLVGSSDGDMTNLSVIELSGHGAGKLLITNPSWTFGSTNSNAGAVTWMDGATGHLSNGNAGGAISSVNSVVGSTTGDHVGNIVAQLSTGDVLLLTPTWTNAGEANAGAVTWMNGNDGSLKNGTAFGGSLSAANSLVGEVSGSRVGAHYTELTDGKLLVWTQDWDAGTTGAHKAGAGAITWMDGSNGRLNNGSSYSGLVSASNSLVGASSGDAIGSAGIDLNFSSGKVVIRSPLWTNGAAAAAGAVTLMDGSNGHLIDNTLGGTISNTNSVVALQANSHLGNYGLIDLGNGKVVLRNPEWNGGRGAVTWLNTNDGKLFNGVVGGEVTNLNSLVGTAATDGVGNLVYPADNTGNYVVLSTLNGDGAITWVNGNSGQTHDGQGFISSANSLMGGSGDQLGNSSQYNLGNGKLAYTSQNWGGGKGAVTWMNGANGQLVNSSFGGTLSATNSLIGSLADGASAGDRVGSGGLVAVGGAYVVRSPSWNGARGAVSQGSINSGLTGTVGAGNSLVGGSAGDQVGSAGIYIISNAAYLVGSPGWGGGGDASLALGAVTFMSVAAPKKGLVSAGNSLVGAFAGDQLGVGNYRTLQSNGNLLITSSHWNGGLGSATWMSGSTGALVDGSLGAAVGAANSLLGSQAGDLPGGDGVTSLTNGNWVIQSANWGGGKGAVTWMNGANGHLANGATGGLLSSSNSFVGTSATDSIGGYGDCDCSYGGEVFALSNGNYVINSRDWNNSTGAVTWGSGSSGLVGTVSAANSALVRTGYLQEDIAGKVLVGGAAANGGRGGLYVVGASSGGAPTFDTGAAADASVGAGFLASTLAAGTNVLLQASNDITVNAGIAVQRGGQNPGASLTLQAGRSIAINADIRTDGGNIVLVANETATAGVVDANRETGAASLSLAGATTLDAGTGRVTLKLLNGAGNTNHAAGSITQGAGAAILANTLDVVTYGGATLTGANAVSVFQLSNSGSADSSFNNAGTSPLALGANGGPGVVGDLGRVKVTTAGNLSLQSIYGHVSSSATGDAVVLASGGNFSDGGMNLTTPNGRWLVYSTAPAANTVTGTTNTLGGGDFKQFAATLATPAAQSTGNGFLYSLAPTLTASLTGTLTRSYNGGTQIALNADNFATTKLPANTDVITVVAQNGSFNSKDVGVATTVTASGMAVASAVTSTGATVYGYQITGTATGTGSISAAPVTVTAQSDSRSYNGTIASTLAPVVTGTLFDTVTTAATQSFDSKNAGTGKTLTASGLVVDDGNGGANYAITYVNSSTGSITAAPLSVGSTDVSKVYDGSLVAAATAVVSAGLKGQFWYDLLAAAPWDLIAFLVVQPKTETEWFSFSALGFLRLLRLRRLFLFLWDAGSDFRYDYFSVSIQKFFYLTLYATHWAACVFFFLARFDDFASYTWVGKTDPDLATAPPLEAYITSLYWAITTLSTTGYGDLSAYTMPERVWTVLFMFSNLALTAYVIGNMTVLLTKADAAVADYRDKLTSVTGYMTAHQVS